MKVEVSSPTKKFEPITLTITIESKEELLDMWARHLAENKDITDAVKHSGDWHVEDKAVLCAAVDSISNDWTEVPLLNVLRPLVESL